MDHDRYKRALALQNTGDDTNALGEFEALAELTSDTEWRSNLLLCQATSLWRMGQLAEARHRLSEAMIYGSHVSMELTDACLCVAEGKREEGLQRLSSFLRRHASLKDSSESNDRYYYAEARENLGCCLFELGRYSDAIGPLEESLAFARIERYKRLCYYLGVCYLKTDDLQAAEDRLLRSLPTEQEDLFWVHGQYQLGCLYFRRGERTKAIEAFQRCRVPAIENDNELKENVETWLAKLRHGTEPMQ